MLSARCGPACQKVMRHFLEAVIVKGSAAELQPATVLAPAQAHGIGELVERREERLGSNRNHLRRVKPGVEVSDDRHPGRAVERLEDVGARQLWLWADLSSGPASARGGVPIAITARVTC